MAFRRNREMDEHDQQKPRQGEKPPPSVEDAVPRSLEVHKPAAIEASATEDANDVADDSLAADLIRRVEKAIDEWARANELGSLPHKIIFQQALSILNALDRSYSDLNSEK